MPRVDTLEQWSRLQARPGHHSIARTETVKFLIDLHDQGRTYFVNSALWVTHYDFILRFVNPNADYSRFLLAEYKRDDRRFILGSIMHYLDGDHWTVELDAGDTLSGERIAWKHRHVTMRFAAVADLRFRPVSPAQIERVEQFGGRVPCLSRDAINASIQYQPVVLGVAYGYLRIFRGKPDVAELKPYDVVVVDQVPEEISPVAALVTGQLQAPLAHVAVLSRNRNTPDMALRGATDLYRFRELEGKLVKLSVASQDFALTLAERSEAEDAWAALRPAGSFRPEGDSATAGFFDVAALPTRAVRYVGAKAAQVGELCAIDGIATPGGFVLPFSAYASHLAASGVDARIAAVLAAAGFRDDAVSRGRLLVDLRSAIKGHNVNPAVLKQMIVRLQRLAPGGRCILRSSTNAEDLVGFNGAGLYESLVLPPAPTTRQVADALRSV